MFASQLVLTKYLHSFEIFRCVLKCRRRKSRQRLLACSCYLKTHNRNVLEYTIQKRKLIYLHTLPGELHVLQR